MGEGTGPREPQVAPGLQVEKGPLAVTLTATHHCGGVSDCREPVGLELFE